jgi:translation initiation factor 3 subunit E
MVQKRKDVLALMESTAAECAPENHGTPAYVDALYRHAKVAFEIGHYSKAADLLGNFRLQCTNADRAVSALWGKLAAEILLRRWPEALEDLGKLNDSIVDARSTSLVQLQQRTWLVHWALFVLFNYPEGRDELVDLLFNERNLQAIQINCPYILRYLTAAVMTDRRRHVLLNQLVQVIQQEQSTYRDPLTEFVECLYINFDFEGAQQTLRKCEVVLENDFFLVSCHEDFIENARLFMFETYCRIHQCIDISMLAAKLNMEQDAAERWIVNLIRNARLDAKIDSKANHVIMGIRHPSVYQQVIEKTAGLSFRGHVLAAKEHKAF